MIDTRDMDLEEHKDLLYDIRDGKVKYEDVRWNCSTGGLKNEAGSNLYTTKSELISADEARRRSDVGKDKAIAREIDRIKRLIDIATGAGEYYVPLPDGAIPHNETIDLLQSKGYHCLFIGDSSVTISWRES